jgi:hypothetical protein
LRVIEPPEAAFHVTAFLVVDPTDTAVVPAAPGSAVWSWMNGVAIAENAVFLRTFKTAFAKLTALIPAVMMLSQSRTA